MKSAGTAPNAGNLFTTIAKISDVDSGVHLRLRIGETVVRNLNTRKTDSTGDSEGSFHERFKTQQNRL